MIFGEEPEPFPHGSYCPSIMAILQGINIYTHCLGNPVLHTDESGEALPLVAIPFIAKGVKAAIVAAPVVKSVVIPVVTAKATKVAVANFATGALVCGTVSAGEQILDDGRVSNLSHVMIDMTVGGLVSMVAGVPNATAMRVGLAAIYASAVGETMKSDKNPTQWTQQNYKDIGVSAIISGGFAGLGFKYIPSGNTFRDIMGALGLGAAEALFQNLISRETKTVYPQFSGQSFERPFEQHCPE
jgi:hypothetical protein